MNACPYNEHIGAYYDGELPPARREDLEHHLPQCAACTGELEQFRRLSALLTSAAVPRLSPAARQHLYALAPQVGEAMYLRVAKWTTALAACVMLAASLWMIADQRTAPQVPTNNSSWQLVAINPPESSDPDPDVRLPDWVQTTLAVSENPSHE